MRERERRLAAVKARVEQATTTADLALVLEPDAIAEAQRLTEVLGDNGDDLQARFLLGWLYFHRYQALREERGRQEELQSAVEMLTPCFIADVDGLPAQLLPQLAVRAIPAAREWYGAGPGSTATALLPTTIGLFRRIASTIPAGHPRQGPVMSCLAIMLEARSERTGALADLDEAIRVGRQAVKVLRSGDSNRAVCLSNLGNALQARFERTGALADLDEAIRVGEEATGATPAASLSRINYLSNLGNALLTRFERSGTRADLDEAIRVGEEAAAAAPVDHPVRAAVLSNLGNALQARSEQTGALADLDEAVRIARESVDTVPADSPDRAKYLTNLGSALLTRFERSGTRADLDEAIAASAAALDVAPYGDPGRAAYLNNLGNALRARYDHTGVLADLDGAISVGKEAAAAISVGHSDRAAVLSNLGSTLRARFERTGVLADLDEAIRVGRAAVNDAPADYPGRAAYLSNLGIALRTRYERTGRRADLNKAIEAGRAAVDAAPADHPGRAAYLSNLGNALRIRSVSPEAMMTSIPDPPGRTRLSSGPGKVRRMRNAVRVRFERRERAHLDEAIKVSSAAIEATPADHPSWAGRMSNLGKVLETKYERTGGQADLEAALTVYAQVVDTDTAPPWVRIQTAHAAARLVARSEPGRAADLLETAVRLLPEVAPRRLGRGDQQHALSGLTALAGDAASLALASTSTARPERARRALQLLEAGRAVLLSQALDTRDDLTDLRQEHPALAARFADLRDRLDQHTDAPGRPAVPVGGTGSAKRPADEVRDRRWLADELTATMAQIRALDGFASFGRPPTTEELLAQAVSGPVVCFNISEYRSDALLLTESGITSLVLPDLTPDALIGQINTFQQAVRDMTEAEDRQDRIAAKEQVSGILEWLWDVATGPVLDALGYHGCPSAGEQRPRVWWIPGGLLGMLPVHAAGHHTHQPDGQDRRTATDRVVSSYTPTVRALHHARQQASRTAEPSTPPPNSKALIVAMPTTPGAKNLDGVRDEIKGLDTFLPDSVLLIEPGPGGSAPGAGEIPTKANVLAHLPGCSIAHFSCHGATDPTDPSQSKLLLHDHDSDPLTVAALTSVKLDQAQLAYLSACRTAVTNAAELIHEPIHITAAFQLAGFPHVIGTLWEIDDAFSADVAKAFYARLSSGNLIDTGEAARALHEAVSAARARHTAHPSQWAAYVHVGA